MSEIHKLKYTGGELDIILPQSIQHLKLKQKEDITKPIGSIQSNIFASLSSQNTNKLWTGTVKGNLSGDSYDFSIECNLPMKLSNDNTGEGYMDVYALNNGTLTGSFSAINTTLSRTTHSSSYAIRFMNYNLQTVGTISFIWNLKTSKKYTLHLYLPTAQWYDNTHFTYKIYGSNNGSNWTEIPATLTLDKALNITPDIAYQYCKIECKSKSALSMTPQSVTGSIGYMYLTVDDTKPEYANHFQCDVPLGNFIVKTDQDFDIENVIQNTLNEVSIEKIIENNIYYHLIRDNDTYLIFDEVNKNGNA